MQGKVTENFFKMGILIFITIVIIKTAKILDCIIYIMLNLFWFTNELPTKYESYKKVILKSKYLAYIV